MIVIPYSFSRMDNTVLTLPAGTPTMAASDNVISHVRLGRNAVIVSNTSSAVVHYGGKDVNADNGIPIAAGETVVFPVGTMDSEKAVYLFSAEAGSVRIAELFE